MPYIMSLNDCQSDTFVGENLTKKYYLEMYHSGKDFSYFDNIKPVFKLSKKNYIVSTVLNQLPMRFGMTGNDRYNSATSTQVFYFSILPEVPWVNWTKNLPKISSIYFRIPKGQEWSE